MKASKLILNKDAHSRNCNVHQKTRMLIVGIVMWIRKQGCSYSRDCNVYQKTRRLTVGIVLRISKQGHS